MYSLVSRREHSAVGSYPTWTGLKTEANAKYEYSPPSSRETFPGVGTDSTRAIIIPALGLCFAIRPCGSDSTVLSLGCTYPGQEYDGSDSGARPDEAVSWGKIKLDAKPVKVSNPPTPPCCWLQSLGN